MNDMRNMIDRLKAANVAYYQENREIMSNYEYYKLYDELVEMEKETGIIYPDSPTQSVGNDILDSLPKEQHEKKMLSLDKTKDVNVLSDWLGNKEGVLSWKLDGLTVVLTYENGKLQKAVTRGNGVVGDIITSNVVKCKNVPLQIPYKEKLIIRGEAVISYPDFEKINAQIEDVDARYKNPRNLASGSIRLLNPSESEKRNVRIIIFRLVEGGNQTSMIKQFEWLSSMGFEVVEHYVVRKETVEQSVKFFERKIEKNEIPTDGLVISYNDTEYGNSLGETSKFEKHSFAFKWKDEIAESVLREIEWSPSRTGLLNPVAIFDSVELEGTTVSRASVHNVSILKELQLGIGDQIQVYKSNMIIPQIAENLTRSNNLKIPNTCPICKGKTEIISSNDTEVLVCTNPHCPEKMIGKFEHFAKRNAMNLVGMSESTIEFLVRKGWVVYFKDFFTLTKYKDAWSVIPKFGEKSVTKLLKAIEESKKTTPERVLYALGIPKIGESQSKEIFKQFKSWNDFIKAIEEDYDFTRLNGFGDTLHDSIHGWYRNNYESEKIPELISCLNISESKEQIQGLPLNGKTFVITGSLEIHKSRNDLKEKIELFGGKVASSVTSKTSYLINNDVSSNSSKNKKAKELNIPIINEESFLKLL